MTSRAVLITAASVLGAAPGCSQQRPHVDQPATVAEVVAAGAEPGDRLVRPADGILVKMDEGVVEIDAWCCLDSGWLEQIACAPNTREHESLVAVKALPSAVHAALLLAGLQPGAPGSWEVVDDEVRLTAPTGDRVDVLVRYDGQGAPVVEPIGAWIVDAEGRADFPDDPWVFGGSVMAPNPAWMDPPGGEHYVADMTGSIIGLVTFGDEVIGYSHVLSDQEAVQPPAWQVRTDHVPPVGTRVTLILQRHVGTE